jgi:Peptidase M15
VPRLPGAESLGGVQADPTRPAGTYDVTPFARGAQAIAQGAENLGRGVSQVGTDLAEVQQRHNEAQYLNATADTATQLANLHTSLQNDKDFSTLEKRYSDGANDIVQKQAQAIPEGPLRTHYLAKSGELVAHGAGAINKQAFNGIVDADSLGLKANLDNLTDDVSKNPGNPFRGSQIDALGLKIDNAVNQGWKTPEEAVLLKRHVAVTVREAELDLLARLGVVTSPEFAVRPKVAAGMADQITRAAQRSGVDEDTLRELAKTRPIDASIPVATRYRLDLLASSAESRRINDEAKLGRQRAENVADEIVLGKTPTATAGVPLSKAGLSQTADVWANDNRTALQAQGVPITVTSAFRNPEHNTAVGGARGSQHLHGNAIDVSLTGLSPQQQQAVVSQFLSDPRTGGFGYYPNSNSIHVDVRPGDKAAWGTDYHGTSVGKGWPDWLTNQVTAWQGGTRPANAVLTQTEAPQGTAPQGQPAAPSSFAEQRAAAMQSALSDPRLQTDEERMYAVQKVKQRFDLLQTTFNQDERAKKEAVDHAAGGYTTQIWDGLHTPNFDWVGLAGQINHDPALADAPEVKERLMERVAKKSGEEQSLFYGPGYLDVKQRVLSEPGSPGHIGTMADVYRLPLDTLTTSGEKEIGQVMAAVRKGPDGGAIERSKLSLLTYAKSKLSFDQEMLFPGAPPLRDRKGEQIFNAQFVPKFEAAYGQWIKDNKDPWDFLSQKHVDEMLQGLRSPAQMKMDRLAATGEAVPEQPGAPPPPTPEGIDPAAWVPLVSSPPMTDAGTPFPRRDWAKALQLLAEKPTAETIKLFDESKFGKAGLEGARLVEQLTAKAKGGEVSEAPPEGFDVTAALPQPKQKPPESPGLFSRAVSTVGEAASSFIERAKAQKAAADQAASNESGQQAIADKQSIEAQLRDLDQQQAEAERLPKGSFEYRQRMARIKRNREFLNEQLPATK